MICITLIINKLITSLLLRLSECVLLRAIWIRLSHPPIWVFSYLRSIWEEDVLLSIGELDCLDTVFLNALDGTVGEYGFLLAVGEDALDGAIGEYNLFGSIRKMLLYLVVCKLEHLQAIRESGLRGLCLCKVVNDLLIGICLLDVVVVEVDYRIAVEEHFSLHSVVEDHFLFPVLIDTLDLAIMSNDLFDHFHIGGSFVVVLLRELHIKLLRFVLIA